MMVVVVVVVTINMIIILILWDACYRLRQVRGTVFWTAARVDANTSMRLPMWCQQTCRSVKTASHVHPHCRGVVSTPSRRSIPLYNLPTRSRLVYPWVPIIAIHNTLQFLFLLIIRNRRVYGDKTGIAVIITQWSACLRQGCWSRKIVTVKQTPDEAYS